MPGGRGRRRDDRRRSSPVESVSPVSARSVSGSRSPIARRRNRSPTRSPSLRRRRSRSPDRRDSYRYVISKVPTSLYTYITTASTFTVLINQVLTLTSLQRSRRQRQTKKSRSSNPEKINYRCLLVPFSAAKKAKKDTIDIRQPFPTPSGPSIAPTKLIFRIVIYVLEVKIIKSHRT